MLAETVRGRCPHCGPDFEREPCARGQDYEYGTTGEQEFTFVRCQSCRTIVLDPRPSDEAIPALYPESYEPYRFAELPPLIRWGREIVQYRKIKALLEWTPEAATIVDVGCGSGSTLRLVRKFGPKDLRLIGWDFPGPHLDHLASAGFETIAAPIVAENTPAQVDVFIMNQVIEHFAEPDALLAALRAALKPGGVLFIETPDTKGLDAKWFKSGYWGGYHIPRHMVLFDRENLCSLLDRQGFRTVATESLPSPAFWIQSLHHLAESRRLRQLARLCTIKNLGLVGAFTAFDMMAGKFRPTSNQRVIALRAD
jgi:SAM-dependent methyltransferase